MYLVINTMLNILLNENIYNRLEKNLETTINNILGEL